MCIDIFWICTELGLRSELTAVFCCGWKRSASPVGMAVLLIVTVCSDPELSSPRPGNTGSCGAVQSQRNHPQASFFPDSRPKQPLSSVIRSPFAITGIAFWPSRPDPVQPDHRLALGNWRHRHPHQRPRRRLAAKPSVCGGVLGSGCATAVPARAVV